MKFRQPYSIKQFRNYLVMGIVGASVTLTGLTIFGDDSKETQRQLYLFFQGREIYQDSCQACHGLSGKGDGPWAVEWTKNRPRNFRSGIFKFKTTPHGALPTDDDLRRTITVGISGTAMPSFKGHLRDEELIAVIAYIKSFSREWKKDERHVEPVELPERPKWISSGEKSKAHLEAGKALFATNCAVCHGAAGKGDGAGAAALKDAWGFDIKPADLSGEHFKSGDSPEDAYRTISMGLGGTPMVGFREILKEEQIWDLVAYVISLRTEKK